MKILKKWILIKSVNKSWQKRCKFLCFIFFSMFIVITIGIKLDCLVSFDDAIRYKIYDTRNEYLTYFWRFITYCGERYTVIALGVVLLILRSTRKNYGIKFAVAALSSTAIYICAKLIFQRPRPNVTLRLITQGGYSFPSGHAMNCLVSYGILIYLILKYCKNRELANVISALLSILIILIGISRIYLGVHYPSDIIGGWSLGLAVLIGFIFLFEKIHYKKS